LPGDDPPFPIDESGDDLRAAKINSKEEVLGPRLFLGDVQVSRLTQGSYTRPVLHNAASTL